MKPILRRLPPLLAIGAAALLLSFVPVMDLDVFWHLKAGQVIAEGGRLLHTNLFASTFPDHPWPNPEWLFQVLLAGVYGLGGWKAVTLFKVSMVLALSGALYLSMVSQGGRRVPAASLTVVALSAMQFRFTERPHLFSYLFTALALLLAERWRRSGKIPWALLPLFALWSNIHPELIIALLCVAGIVAGEWANGAFGGRKTRGVAALAVPAALCLPAACLNPEGYHVLVFPFLHTFIGPVIEVTEYAVAAPSGMPLFWAFVLALAGIFLLRGRRNDWAEVLPVAGTALLGVLYQRATPYVFLVGAPVLCRHFSRPDTPRSWMAPRRVDLLAALFAALSFTWAVSCDRLNPYRWGWGVDESDFPAAAADLLSTGRLPGRLYNSYDVGGYLAYRLYPVMGVFQDGRLQAYPPEFIADFNANFSLDRWPALLERYDVNTALVQRPGQEILFSRERWGIVSWDETWVLLLRRSPGTADLLEEMEYRVFLPGVNPAGVEDRRLLEKFLVEMERNQSQRRAPGVETENNRGVVLQRLGRGEEARAAYRYAAGRGYAPAWANLGSMLLAEGNVPEGRRALRRALAIDPGLEGVRDLLDRYEGRKGEGVR